MRGKIIFTSYICAMCSLLLSVITESLFVFILLCLSGATMVVTTLVDIWMTK